MPHHFKCGGEKQRLPLLLRTKKRHPPTARFVKKVTDQQT